MANAQEIEGTVLKSWPGASGAIEIPAHVTEIAANCFYEPAEEDPDEWGTTSEEKSNTDITSVKLNNVKKIGKNAFRGCSNIETIDAPKVEIIEEGAFYGLDKLTTLRLPMIKELGMNAFEGCNRITEITLGNGLTKVFGNTFKDCKAVENITVAAGSTYKTVRNALISPAKTLVYLAGQAKEIKLSADECTAIGDEAMYGNANLTKVDLPGVKTIGKNSFTYCSALAELLVPNLVSVATNSYVAWSGVGSLAVVDIHLSKDFVSFGATEFADKTSTTIYVADENVKAKLEKKFNKCKIVIGEPQAAEKFKVNYAITNIEVNGKKIGEIEAWTNSARNFESGAEIAAGNAVSVSVTPYGGYKIDKWEINGKPAAAENIRPSSSINGEIWSIDHISETLNVLVTLKAEEEGDIIFFKSKEPTFGDVTCTVVETGKQIKTAEKVKKGTKLRFEAFPKEGYHVTQWYKLGKEVVTDENGNKQTVETYQPIPGYDNATIYECNAVDALDILVDFDRAAGKHIVKFRSLNTNTGELTAAVGGKDITTGTVVDHGATVVFTAHPKEGYVVDTWLLNENELKNEKGLTYTITDLKEDVTVWLVCSTKSEEPESKPEINGGHLISWKPKGKAVTPDGVEYIDNNALQASTELESFHITKSVKSIGELVFLFCTQLTEITVDPENEYFTAVDGVLYSKDKTRLMAYPPGRTDDTYEVIQSATSIKPGAFALVPSLLGVTVAKGNTALRANKGALYTRNMLELLYYPTIPQTGPGTDKITLNEGLEKIARYGLAYNHTVTEITLPATLKTIEANGLSNNPNLNNIKWEEGVEPELEEIGDSAFYHDGQLAALRHIPSLKKIGAGAFIKDAALLEVHIPAGCTIGDKAFFECLAIQQIYAYDMVPPVVADDAFNSIYYLDEVVVHVDKNAVEAYKKADGWRHFKHYQTDIVTAIGTATANADSAVRVIAQSNGYTVEGLKAGQRYTLCTVSGMQVAAGVADGSSLFIPVQRNGIYILNIVGVKTCKLF
ncbi:hypothetical protein JCM15124A_03910 [Prevotella falsenii]